MLEGHLEDTRGRDVEDKTPRTKITLHLTTEVKIVKNTHTMLKSIRALEFFFLDF